MRNLSKSLLLLSSLLLISGCNNNTEPTITPHVDPEEGPNTPMPGPTLVGTEYDLLEGFNFSGGYGFKNNTNVQELKAFLNGNCDNKVDDLVTNDYVNSQPNDGTPNYLTLGSGSYAGQISIGFTDKVKQVKVICSSYHKYTYNPDVYDKTNLKVELESDSSSDSQEIHGEVATMDNVEFSIVAAKDFKKLTLRSFAEGENNKYRVFLKHLYVTF